VIGPVSIDHRVDTSPQAITLMYYHTAGCGERRQTTHKPL